MTGSGNFVYKRQKLVFNMFINFLPVYRFENMSGLRELEVVNNSIDEQESTLAGAREVRVRGGSTDP